MDINFQGVRASAAIDVKPAAEKAAPVKDLVGSVGHQLEEEAGKPGAEPVQSAVDSPEALGQAVSYLQEFAQSIQRDLSFSLDDASGRIVIEVRDQASGDVIRQIPSEDALRVMKHLEEARSLLFHTTA